MNIFPVLLIVLLLFMHPTVSRRSHFRECPVGDDCYSYGSTYDLRNVFLDMLQDIKDNSNNTLNLPDLQLMFSFHNGTFNFDYSEDCCTCICPLNEKDSKVYAVYHVYYVITTYRYEWSLHSTNLTGELEIESQLSYSVYLLNDTNSLPKVEKVNSTDFRIVSWWFDGIPLEWLERITDTLFKKIVSVPLKKFTEDKLTDAYNDSIKRIFGVQSGKVKSSKTRAKTRHNLLKIVSSPSLRKGIKSRKITPNRNDLKYCTV